MNVQSYLWIMAAIPIVIFDGGFCEIKPGTLISPPAEFFSVSQKSFYALAKAGWQRCPLGYGVYSAIDPLGRKIVIPGIYVLGDKPPKSKFPNYPLKFTKRSEEHTSELQSLMRISYAVFC